MCMSLDDLGLQNLGQAIEPKSQGLINTKLKIVSGYIISRSDFISPDDSGSFPRMWPHQGLNVKV